MGAFYLCCCLGFLFIPILNAKTLKLVPGKTKTITTNGATHEISRYFVVPDDQNNGHTKKTTKAIIKLLTAKKNKMEKALNETTDNSGTNNETNVEKLRNNLIKTLQIMRARQDNADSYSKSTEIPSLDKNQSFFRSLSDSNSNSEHEVVSNWNTAKNNGKGTEEHIKVTLNLKPRPTVSQSKEMNIQYNNEENLQNASEFITQDKLERPATKMISNINVHSSKSDEEDEIQKAKEKLIEVIGINKMFTIPGKRGRYKLLYEEENDSQDNVERKIYTTHYFGQPKHKTVTHFYSNRNIPNEQEYFSQGSHNFVTHTDDSVPDTNLDKNIRNNELNIRLHRLNINNGDDNLSLVSETSDDKKHGLEVVTGKMDLLKEAPENNNLDTHTLTESKYNFVNTEPTLNELASDEALKHRDRVIYPEAEKHEVKHKVESVPKETDTSIRAKILEPSRFFVPSFGVLNNYNSTTVPKSDIKSTTTVNPPTLSDNHFTNGSLELTDTTVEHSTAGVNMKTSLGAMENMDAEQIESLPASAVFYKTENPSIDLVTEPSVELLDNDKDINVPKLNTDTTISKTEIIKMPSKIGDYNYYEELNDDKNTTDPGKNNEFENKMIPKGVKEPSVAEVSERPEVFRDNITVPATKNNKLKNTMIPKGIKEHSLTEEQLEVLRDSDNITVPATQNNKLKNTMIPKGIKEHSVTEEQLEVLKDSDNITVPATKNNKLKNTMIHKSVEEHSVAEEHPEVLKDNYNITVPATQNNKFKNKMILKGVEEPSEAEESKHSEILRDDNITVSETKNNEFENKIIPKGVEEHSGADENLEVLRDSDNITVAATKNNEFENKMILKGVEEPSEAEESEHSEILRDNDNITVPEKKNNEFENKIIPKGVEEHSLAEEHSEVLRDSDDIAVPATKKSTVSTVVSEPDSHETNLSKELEKEAAELVTVKDEKDKTIKLPNSNNKTEKHKINYTAVPEDNLGLVNIQRDVNKYILTKSSGHVNPSMLEQAGLLTKKITETRPLDDFYHDKARKQPDNSNNQKLKPGNGLYFKVYRQSEAVPFEIKQRNKDQVNNYVKSDRKRPTYHNIGAPVQISDREENRNIKKEHSIPIHIRPNRVYSPPYTPAISPFQYKFGNTEAYRNQNDYSQRNLYSNFRMPYVISNEYLRQVLSFLASKNVMQLLTLKYDMGYGNKDEIRKSHIIEQLRNLGLDRIHPNQLFILTQFVRNLEDVNEKDNQMIDYKPNSVIQYYYIPYANVYPFVQSQNGANLYLLHNTDVNYNTAINELVSKAMNTAMYLRTQGVSEYQISFFIAKVHEYLNYFAVQTYLSDSKKEIITGLSLKIDSLARQAMMI